ncbi:MAG: vanadium-dependent haloperoxidase [Candidatus Methylophosphatis roskildensis]
MIAMTLCASPIVFSALARADAVIDWNQTAIRATEVAALPPPPQSRAMAMVHAAVYDAVNAIDGRYAAYAVDIKAPAAASKEAAAASAGHGVLIRLFPEQQPSLDAALDKSLGQIADGDQKNQGASIGREAATRLYEMRKTDGAAGKGEYTFGTGPGVYQQTPPMNAQPVLPHWRHVKPFVLGSATRFLPPGPPAYGSAEFVRDFEEVKALGARDSRTRTNEQTAIALFWAGSEIPPLNTIARSMSAAKGQGIVDNARLFAYINMAIADSLIAGFEAKYRFNSWRPVTAIREAASTGNPRLAADTHWEPLMVTPPHPEYPSAHCLGTGAAAQVLAGFFGTEQVQVSLVQPPLGFFRRYDSLQALVQEMENARVWGGIHFRSADEHGTRLGRQIGQYVLNNALQPVSKSAAAGGDRHPATE